MSSHSGWSENQQYGAGVRQTWTATSASGGSVTGTSNLSVTMNAGATVKGIFLTDSNTKGGTTGNLWCTGLFATAQTLTNGQTLSFNYTCPLTAT
jgi:hypothetical protein